MVLEGFAIKTLHPKQRKRQNNQLKSMFLWRKFKTDDFGLALKEHWQCTRKGGVEQCHWLLTQSFARTCDTTSSRAHQKVTLKNFHWNLLSLKAANGPREWLLQIFNEQIWCQAISFIGMDQKGGSGCSTRGNGAEAWVSHLSLSKRFNEKWMQGMVEHVGLDRNH